MIDNESDEEIEMIEEPVPKRRMIESHFNVSTRSPTFDPTGEASQASAETVLDIASQSPPEKEGEASYDAFEKLRKKLFSLPSTLPLATSERLVNGETFILTTCNGTTIPIRERKRTNPKSYESIIANRSKVREGRARKAYYGVDIHALVDDAKAENSITKYSNSNLKKEKPIESIEKSHHLPMKKSRRSLLWTEKYRARNFMDLCGDDTTNRMVLRWLKRWDPIVFPHIDKKITKKRSTNGVEEERTMRKILMLTGPPGLGKTTLAHVCARQAGYDVLEINASDDRSKDVVKNRIRTTLGTDTVKNVTGGKNNNKPAKPICVIVDEVDGVVSGAGGGGEGGFVKELINLVMTDQKNNTSVHSSHEIGLPARKKRKGDDFRQMRPLILICNDIYATALRPLRMSNLAEIIHAGKPGIDAVVQRLKSVFEKEGISCEKDAARRLCEAAWGITSGLDAKKGANSTTEGDLRGIMVVGEWVAGRLRSTCSDQQGIIPSLTRKWVEQNVLSDLSHGGGSARGIGRGGSKEIVTRLFQDGAGFPKPLILKSSSSLNSVDSDGSSIHISGPKSELPKTSLHFAEQQRKHAIFRLREMVDTSGEVDRIVTELWTEYPSREFNDDSFLSKPNECYDWLHFHDSCTTRIYGGSGGSQEWELGPYLASPVLAAHLLFAGPIRHAENRYNAEKESGSECSNSIFSGPRADFIARETEKANRAMLAGLQAQLSPTLGRSFKSPEDIAAEFLPWLMRMINPDVKPVVVGNTGDYKGLASVRKESEKILIRRAAEVLADVGIELVRGKLEDGPSIGPGQRGNTTWVYRLEPDLDALAYYETAAAIPFLAGPVPTRYAVRQVLDQELVKTIAARENQSRMARFRAGGPEDSGVIEMDIHKDNKENLRVAIEKESVKRDFFGRVITQKPLKDQDGNAEAASRKQDDEKKTRRLGHISRRYQ